MGSALVIDLSSNASKDSKLKVKVDYSTGSDAAALQFLDKE
jgi:hypothetical protein